MAIRLELKNNNTVPVDVKVYRSDTPIDRHNLPAPIVSLTQVMGDPIVINDTTAVQDQFYNYVFQVIGAKDQQLSRNFNIQATETRGPGKSKILVGDATLGFMDMLTPDMLVGGQDLLAALGVPTGTFTGPNSGNTNYLIKYIRNNKIYYVPNIPIAWNMTKTQMISFGLDKTKQLQIQGRTYNVRNATMWDESSNDPASNTGLDMDDSANLKRISEFNDLYYPLLNFTPAGMRLPTVLAQAYSTMGLNSYPYILGNEVTPNNSAVARGRSSNSRLALTGYSAVAVGQGCMYWPLLELVEG